MVNNLFDGINLIQYSTAWQPPNPYGYIPELAAVQSNQDVPINYGSSVMLVSPGFLTPTPALRTKLLLLTEE